MKAIKVGNKTYRRNDNGEWCFEIIPARGFLPITDIIYELMEHIKELEERLDVVERQAFGYGED